jgi:hypothetical protein
MTSPCHAVTMDCVSTFSSVYAMEELFRAMRHSTLEAIDKGEKLLEALVGKTDKVSDALRESTERMVEKLKKELERYEKKYKKAKAKLK